MKFNTIYVITLLENILILQVLLKSGNDPLTVSHINNSAYNSEPYSSAYLKFKHSYNPNINMINPYMMLTVNSKTELDNNLASQFNSFMNPGTNKYLGVYDKLNYRIVFNIIAVTNSINSNIDYIYKYIPSSENMSTLNEEIIIGVAFIKRLYELKVLIDNGRIRMEYFFDTIMLSEPNKIISTADIIKFYNIQKEYGLLKYKLYNTNNTLEIDDITNKINNFSTATNENIKHFYLNFTKLKHKFTDICSKIILLYNNINEKSKLFIDIKQDITEITSSRILLSNYIEEQTNYLNNIIRIRKDILKIIKNSNIINKTINSSLKISNNIKLLLLAYYILTTIIN